MRENTRHNRLGLTRSNSWLSLTFLENISLNCNIAITEPEKYRNIL